MPRQNSISSPYLIVLLLLSICLWACGTKNSTYTPAEGEVQWIQFGTSTSTGATFFISTDNDSLLVMPRVEINSRFQALDSFRSIEVDLADLAPPSELTATFADDGHYQLSQTAADWTTARAGLRTYRNASDTLGGTLTVSRRYPLSSFPASLTLRYKINMSDTSVEGSVQFMKVETEGGGVMRWH